MVAVIYSLVFSFSYAMYGDLLPLENAPLSSCKVSINDDSNVCTGSVIAPNVLKTAAHCLRRKQKDEIKVICPITL